MLAEDLRATINSSQKEAAKFSLETKIKLALIRLCTSVWITDILESMLTLKRFVQDASQGSQAIEVLLNEESGEESSPLQLIMLTLLLPHDAATVAITILLALSFSSKHADSFVR
jgi:ABC-type transport system involved in cytochrome c biogenesis permease component